MDPMFNLVKMLKEEIDDRVSMAEYAHDGMIIPDTMASRMLNRKKSMEDSACAVDKALRDAVTIADQRSVPGTDSMNAPKYHSALARVQEVCEKQRARIAELEAENENLKRCRYDFKEVLERELKRLDEAVPEEEEL